MNKKALLFKDMLERLQFAEAFTVEETEGSVVFQSALPVRGQQLATVIELDDSLYSLLHVQILPQVAEGANRDRVLAYCNELNGLRKLTKFHITRDGLLMTNCVTSTDETFDPELFRLLLSMAMQELEEQYPKFLELAGA